MGSWIRKPGWCIYNLSNALKPEQGILVLIKVIENRKIYEIISKDDSSLVCSCMTQMSLLFTKNKDNNMQGHIFGGGGELFSTKAASFISNSKEKKKSRRDPFHNHDLHTKIAGCIFHMCKR